ncbi:MAG: tetratricopeptide repeat protein [Flavobacteriaceae bacterium]|nr:tetratricopeptide repeat protein [Flavobacteriaceae bacterium]
MKTVVLIFSILLIVGCSNSVTYSDDHIQQTSGRYLYGSDEVLEVYYENNDLYLSWRSVKKIKPVIIDENTFFVADMYKKLRFVEHNNQRYLSVVNPDDEDKITYDYLKISDTTYIPSEHLAKENFDKALEGYLSIKAQDDTDYLIDEGDLNRLGYNYLREKDYQNAIAVFKMNVALYPESDNVYDSLADGYLRSGDSAQAFTNYKKALELNKDNKRAKKYTEDYNKQIN